MKRPRKSRENRLRSKFRRRKKNDGLCKIIYTTNTIKGNHRQIRKATKNKGGLYQRHGLPEGRIFIKSTFRPTRNNVFVISKTIECTRQILTPDLRPIYIPAVKNKLHETTIVIRADFSIRFYRHNIFT